MWLTLIKSNPQYKKKRAEFLYDNFNPNGLNYSTVFSIIQNTDRISDKYNETSGLKLTTELMYSSIFQSLGYGQDQISQDLLLEVKLKINELFFEYRPLMLNHNILEMLIQLKDEEYSLNISSNTGFIEGIYLMKLFELIGLDRFFDFAIFSDEINASKPSPIFYENVFKRIKGDKHQVIHIGDNYNADYIGATKFGFNALQIKNPEYSINIVRKAIYEKNRKF